VLGDHWRPSDEDIPEFIAAVDEARVRLAGEVMSIRLRKIEQTANTRDLYKANGWPVPQWARNTLSFLDEYRSSETETENLDDALSALKAAVN
jgi:hypothetical protein